MYGPVSISRSLLNRNNIRFSTDDDVTHTELPKLGLIYDAIANGVNNKIPNSVNKNLSPRNLMIFTWSGRENFRLKFDWRKATINGVSSASVPEALTNMQNLLSENISSLQSNYTAGTYTVGAIDFMTGMAIIVNTGTITIDGGTPLAAGTYLFNAPTGSYLSSKQITLTGTANIIYEFIV